jgi:hypothetical protein
MPLKEVDAHKAYDFVGVGIVLYSLPLDLNVVPLGGRLSARPHFRMQRKRPAP